MEPISIEMNKKYKISEIAELKLIPFKSGGFCGEKSIYKLIDEGSLKASNGKIQAIELLIYLESTFPDLRISRIYA